MNEYPALALAWMRHCQLHGGTSRVTLGGWLTEPHVQIRFPEARDAIRDVVFEQQRHGEAPRAEVV